MFIRKLVIVFSLILLSLESFAYTPQEGNVSGLLGPMIYKTNFNGSSSVPAAPWLGSFGIMAIGDVSATGSLEIAMYFMNKIYYRHQASQYISDETQLVHVSMGYRWWLNSAFSVSLGFFSGYPVGDIRILHSDFPQAIDTSANVNTSYGVDLGLEAELWTHDRWAVVGDVRYSRLLTARDDESGDHYGLLLGLRYFIKEKKKADKPT